MNNNQTGSKMKNIPEKNKNKIKEKKVKKMKMMMYKIKERGVLVLKRKT